MAGKAGNPAWVKGMKPPYVAKHHNAGMQDPGPRAKVLVEKHGAAAVLRAMRDEKFLADNFSIYDGMIIIGLGNALKGSGEERERMFNRMFGKVPDKTINLNLNVEVQPSQITARAEELLEQLGNQED